jgi:hypothetical protein
MSSSRWWAVFLGVTIVEVLLLVKLLTSQASIELLIAIGVVAVLLILTLRIEDLSTVALNRDGLKAELSKVEQKLESKVNQVEDNIKEEVKDKVNQLGDDINDLLFLTILDAYEYITLQKAKGDELDDSYQFNYPKGQDLIERLRNRGLIEEKNGDSIFNDRNDRRINIREHFLITDRGNKYLDALNQKGLGKELESIAKKTGYRSNLAT